MSVEQLYLIHHSHTDIGYTHDQPIVWELERRFLDAALDLCEQGQCAEKSRPIRAGEIPAAEGLTTHGEASLGSTPARAPMKRRQRDDRAVTRQGEGIEPRYVLKPRADRVVPLEGDERRPTR